MELLEVRPQVAAFAIAMEERLRANEHKGGWSACRPDWLWYRLMEEACELKNEIDKAGVAWNGASVLHEAADVANMAMMVADVTGGLFIHKVAREIRKLNELKRIADGDQAHT